MFVEALALSHLAEYHVLAVQEVGVDSAEKELAAVGVTPWGTARDRDETTFAVLCWQAMGTLLRARIAPLLMILTSRPSLYYGV